ncbi:transcriptional regulator ATRX homolog [Adelges cooleyi]|uniref:transcriptional regulator ATRX homolog n=1 Tax=Adelges cooleyi TaxID=133065 RepID=UPI00217FEE04|nr:transcriptional regulator ATRX homolog [Adelges cooleyi]XP_050421527.1 transcriptional regulator ATRX homolog [Adelges cooleyi]
MNSVGAMSSPVKQPLPPTVLAPPNISTTTTSPSKVQPPPSLTPLNLNTTAQAAQPLSLVNEHKTALTVVPSPIVNSVETTVQKSSSCNGVSEAKTIEKKAAEPPNAHQQTTNTNIVTLKNIIEPPTDVKITASVPAPKAENLSQKKEEKTTILPPKKADTVLPNVKAPVNEVAKSESGSESTVVKPVENESKVSQEPTEAQTAAKSNQEQVSSVTVSATPEKIEQGLPNISKVAAGKRKREHRQLESEKEEVKDKTSNKDNPTEEIKSKRTRLPTQPFQLSLPPEIQLMTKIATKSASSSKINNEKLTVFYKNEFLAVRNEEGGFYLCQAMQNIHRASRRIRIRWLAQIPNDEFKPDFYDHTEFDCILTNITLKKVQKEQWKLPEKEKLRIENILKRSIDVEKGSEKPSVTEEHPDGLDVSLYKDEAQLTKKKKSITVKRKVSTDEQQPVKKSSRLSKNRPSYDFGHSSSESEDEESDNDDTKDNKSSKTKPVPKKVVKKKPAVKEPPKKSTGNVSKKSVPTKKSQAPVKPTYVLASVSSALKKREISATKQKKEAVAEKKPSKKVDQKSPAVPLPSERSSKTRNAGNAVTAKITTAGIGVVKSNSNSNLPPLPSKDRKARNRK